jgi:hypothetical protein
MNDELVKDIQAAKNKIAEGSFTIWHSRLELVAESGKLKDLLDVLVSPIDQVSGNNGCNHNCGCVPDASARLLGKQL